MKQRVAMLCDSVDDATSVVDTLREKGIEDTDIHVVTNADIVLEDLPESDPRQHSDLFPAIKRGAGAGGATGLFAGLLMATVPVAGIAVGGAAIAAMTAGGAAFGAWSSSLVGAGLPNTTLDDFNTAIEKGGTLVLADVEADAAPTLMEVMQRLCRTEIVRADTVDKI